MTNELTGRSLTYQEAISLAQDNAREAEKRRQEQYDHDAMEPCSECATLRERLAAAEAMIHYAVPIVIRYAKASPRWMPESWSPVRGQQDPYGAHAWLDRYDAVWKPKPQQSKTAEDR